MPIYYNHSNHRVRVFIPDERQTRVGRIKNRRTMEVQKETREHWCEPLGTIELPLAEDVVKKKAPQLSLVPPTDEEAYDKNDAAKAAAVQLQKYTNLGKPDCVRLCELLNVDVDANVAALRTATGSDRGDKPPLLNELAELLVLFEKKHGEKKMGDALANLSASGSGRLSDEHTAE